MGGWDGTEPGQVTPNDQKDIPFPVTSCSGCKGEGKKEGLGDIWIDVICLSK